MDHEKVYPRRSENISSEGRPLTLTCSEFTMSMGRRNSVLDQAEAMQMAQGLKRNTIKKQVLLSGRRISEELSKAGDWTVRRKSRSTEGGPGSPPLRPASPEVFISTSPPPQQAEKAATRSPPPTGYHDREEEASRSGQPLGG